MTHAAIYARISDDREGEERGVQRQVEDSKHKAESLGLSVVATFIDNDISASTRSRKQRPQYAEMLDRARAGDFGTIIAYSNSRLTRRPRELEDLIILFERHGVVIRTVVSGDDNLGTADGRMVARIKASVDAAEAERTGERVARARAQSAAQGHAPPSVGFGHRRVGRAVEIVEEEAVIIREVAARILAGESARAVAASLNERGIPSRRGAAWGTTTLRQMILRPSLTGARTYRGEIVTEHAWPAILDADTYDRLKAVFLDPSRRSHYGGRAPKYLLAGLINCGLCGGVMKRNPGRLSQTKAGGTRRQPASYVCSKCFRVRRKQSSLDEFVTRLIVGRLEREDAFAAFSRGDPGTAEKLAGEIAGIDARLATSADQFAEGAITVEQLVRITERLRTDREKLEQQRRRMLPPSIPEGLTGPGAGDRWEALSIDQQRALVALLVRVVVQPVGAGRGRVFDPETVTVEWLSATT